MKEGGSYSPKPKALKKKLGWGSNVRREGNDIAHVFSKICTRGRSFSLLAKTRRDPPMVENLIQKYIFK